MDRIRLRNYRCFDDTGDIEIKPITLLLGANSSGKSSFLKFFPLLKQSIGVRRVGTFLWYGSDVDFKDFENTLKSDADSMTISWQYDDFAVNGDSRTILRLRKYYNNKKLGTQKIKIELSMTISARKDNFDKLDKLDISFLDERITLNVEESGQVKVYINGREFKIGKGEIRFADSTFLLPRLFCFYVIDGSSYTGSFSRFVSQTELFSEDYLRDFKELVLTGDMIFLSQKDYISLFKSIINNENVDYEKLHDWYLLANLDDLIETINYRIQTETYLMSYVKPLRVMPERYYRYQNYSVDDIDSDGKNLAMFLANLSELEMKQFQYWTNNNFGFKIYTNKHEGHVELAIGKTKKEARNLVDVGFGYTQLLPIITIIWNLLNGKGHRYYYPRTGNPVKLIAIEQPELHLHPRVQSLFAESLVNVINNITPSNNIRFVVETHSEAIINKIGSMVQDGKLAKENVNVVLFNGISEGLEDYIVEAEFDEEGYLTKWPLGFFL